MPTDDFKLTPPLTKKEKRYQYQRRYDRKYPDRKLNRALKHKYNGFTLDDKKALFEKQRGICPICHLALPPVENHGCCVDHDHVSMKVRGLLHKGCNVWLGFIEKHGKAVLVRGEDYLDSVTTG